MTNNPKPDHDLIIKLETTQNHMCTKLDYIVDKVDKIDDKMNCFSEKCAEERSKRITWNHFIIVMTIIIGISGVLVKIIV